MKTGRKRKREISVDSTKLSDSSSFSRIVSLGFSIASVGLSGIETTTDSAESLRFRLDSASPGRGGV